MTRVHYLPIEPSPVRYSGPWLDLWQRGLQAQGFETNTIAPARAQNGGPAVRDPLCSTTKHIWEGWQSARLSLSVRQGLVADDDIVLYTEGHSFGPLAAAYLRTVTESRYRIAVVLHASTWDPFDFLVRYGVGAWMRSAELAVLLAVDVILLATEFHRGLILAWLPADVRDEIDAKIRVTGFPLTLPSQSFAAPWRERGRVVVFPHRLTVEKGVGDLEWLRQRLPDVEFVCTQDVMAAGGTVDDYRIALGRARVVLSCAQQETWGIAQLEGWALGAYPVVPCRLSYRELYPAVAQYGTLEEAAALIEAALCQDVPAPFVPSRHPDAAFPAIGRVLREEV